MFNNPQNKEGNNKESAQNGDGFQTRAPAIQVPKGGGAIRGIGEKFAANPVTGTGSMTVPIATSPGRSGFGPQLSLSYDSGAGNGPFGLGWNLSLPTITRKTDKGLPKYRDAEESDVFIISGAEDLVPVLRSDGSRFVDETSAPDHTILRYRPRIEGLFARIERWTHKTNPKDTFWRSISKDNITTWYGKTDKSRITDPDDPTRIFSWLISEMYDDKGNVIVYEYVPEDSKKIVLTQVHERNRTDAGRSANRYLKRIQYGNKISRLRQSDLSAMDWMFEVVFDYDEGHYETLDPDSQGRQFVNTFKDKQHDWSIRQDPLSSYKAGFEIRTYRLCHRVLMFHHFKDELGIDDYIVRSTEFSYDEGPIASFITGVTQSGYKHQNDETYLKKSLPPLEYQYSKAEIQEEVQTVDRESLENLPQGLDGGQYRWVDLDGEGFSGILAEQGDAWYYKENLSSLPVQSSGSTKHVAHFAPVRQVRKMPSMANLNASGQQLLDLAGDGQLDLVEFDKPTPGFYERTHDKQWETFQPFTACPNLPWQDQNLRFIDLTGDGHADILITEDDAFTWYESLAEEGFASGERVRQSLDEEKGPRLVVADGTQSVYLADISGDGLTDLVRIRNGEVCYWPNLGYGRFGAKVTMDNAPWFDTTDQFDQRRIRLADIDGSGVTDIIYLKSDCVDIYLNQSGNRWAEVYELKHFPRIDDLSSVIAVDLFGNGTACLVWSSSLHGDSRQPMRYVDLMGGLKPHLLTRVINNLGAETEIEYAPSTKFYLADKQAGTPWLTRLPFPVHVVERTTVKEKWRNTTFSTRYSYHHGYYDGIEREFRGFGRVEQVDVESYGKFIEGNTASPYISDDKTLYQPPVKTITWFHTGAFIDRDRMINGFREEYFPNWLDEAGYTIDSDYHFSERELPEPDFLTSDVSTEELREALRACKGITLRQETYELDVDALEVGRHVPVKLFSTACHNCQIRRIQPRDENRHAVFLVTESEAITYHYEIDMREPVLKPDPRIAHTLTLNTNEYGQPLQALAVAYPRVRLFQEEALTLPVGTDILIRRVQNELHLSYTETHYTNDVDLPDHYRLRLPCEVKTYELTGIRPQDEDDRTTIEDPWDDVYFTLDELRRFRLSEIYQTGGETVSEIEYHQLPNHSDVQKRIVEHVRILYFNENLHNALLLGELNWLGLTYETYKLALTEDLLDTILRNKLETVQESGEDYETAVRRILQSGGYYRWNDRWWIRSGIAGFADDARHHFYLPEKYTDPFGEDTLLEYDKDYDLYIRSSKDPAENEIVIESFDFRVLAPEKIKDMNDNVTAVAFDTLGMPIGSAVMGNTGTEFGGTESGDTLSGFHEDLVSEEIRSIFIENYDETEKKLRDWLGTASARYVYYLGEERTSDGTLTYGVHPACACSILREKHIKQLDPNEKSRLQVSFAYSDGMGQPIVTKAKAEPEVDGGPFRWIANGKTILNNKGKPVKQYEPYFSKDVIEHPDHRFKEPLEKGVATVMYYDAIGRLIRTEKPNKTYSRVEFSPWFVKSFDANDTVLEDGNAWYARSSSASASPEMRRTAELTVVHANTPAQVFLDSLGREVVAVTHNRYRDDAGTVVDEKYVTFTRLDAEGKPLWIRDARKNLVMQYITPPKATTWVGEPNEDVPTGSVPCYDIAGNLLFQHSMDAGDRWMLMDVTGKPLYGWDSRDNILRTHYDKLRRPQKIELRNDSHLDWTVVNYTQYGEAVPDSKVRNLRGQIYRSYDQSGMVNNWKFDYKGNLLEIRRRLAGEYKHDVNWQEVESLVPDGERDSLFMREIFTQITEYDALNRMMRLYNWHQGVGTRVAVYEPHYNERGLLKSEDLILDASKTSTLYENGTSKPVIRKITYNEKGQRLSIEFGNGATTDYEYDEETFRLIHLNTTRDSRTKDLQNLRYTYDPVGNITEMRDDAQPTVFFNNFQIDARNRYTYDALYQLREAQGREHAGQVVYNTHDNWNDCSYRRRYHTNDAMAWRNYTQQYTYDEVGNILRARHTAHGDGESSNSWTRHYQYEPGSNRLLATGTGVGSSPIDHYPETPSLDYRYIYNPHGSMTKMPHLSTMEWDFTEHLHHVVRATGTQGIGMEKCPDTSLEAWYRYDAGKQRTRKRVVKKNGIVEERLYLGGYELFRKYNSSGGITLERETVHVADDTQRIAMIDTRLQGNDSSPEQSIRYQFGNHLGSACLELDENGKVITYEEHHPYGTTAYQAVRHDIEVSSKRYRYTGMERDEETGLNYHTARYYAPWLGRWVSTDPLDIVAGVNQFTYVNGNPVRLTDTIGLQGNEPLISTSLSDLEIPPQHDALGLIHAFSEMEMEREQTISQEEQLRLSLEENLTGDRLLNPELGDESIRVPAQSDTGSISSPPQSRTRRTDPRDEPDRYLIMVAAEFIIGVFSAILPIDDFPPELPHTTLETEFELGERAEAGSPRDVGLVMGLAVSFAPMASTTIMKSQSTLSRLSSRRLLSTAYSLAEPAGESAPSTILIRRSISLNDLPLARQSGTLGRPGSRVYVTLPTDMDDIVGMEHLYERLTLDYPGSQWSRTGTAVEFEIRNPNSSFEVGEGTQRGLGWTGGGAMDLTVEAPLTLDITRFRFHTPGYTSPWIQGNPF
ncbi:MAG: hypothetical protein MRK02_08235 [Candidatus Scalindua sp.]|nr:hypothetical protein [Candidatus Scalindua sp.]